MPPLVSILIPAYNAEHWIGDSIESALGQTWDTTEIIVVDDGSTDRTREVAEAFKCSRLLVTSGDRRGASAARNTALSLSKGDYVQWLDADDVLHPQKIEIQLRDLALRRSQSSERVLLSCSWSRFYFRKEKARPARSDLWESLTPHEWFRRKFNHNSWMAIETWLVSRDIAEKAGPWDENLTMDDDGEYVSRIVASSDEILFVPEASLYVRQANLGSLSRAQAGDRAASSQFSSMEKQIERFLELRNDAQSRAACVNYLQRWMIHFYPEYPEIVNRATALAESFGGRLTEPEMRAKYRALKAIFGWKIAKRIAVLLPNIRARIACSVDKFFFSRRARGLGH